MKSKIFHSNEVVNINIIGRRAFCLGGYSGGDLYTSMIFSKKPEIGMVIDIKDGRAIIELSNGDSGPLLWGSNLFIEYNKMAVTKSWKNDEWYEIGNYGDAEKLYYGKEPK